jgi:hypothetical protein
MVDWRRTVCGIDIVTAWVTAPAAMEQCPACRNTRAGRPYHFHP